MLKANRYLKIILLLALCAGAVFRLIYLIPPIAFQGDDAVSALIAKHIFELKEFPIYHWKAHYLGVLVSYIGALLYWMLGVSAVTFKIVGVLFSFIWIALTVFLINKVFDYHARIFSFLLVVLPPAEILRFSMYSSGIYAETFAFGTLAFIMLIKLRRNDFSSSVSYLTLGLILGVGLWISPFMLIVILSLIAVYVVEDKAFFRPKRLFLALTGFFIGLLPAIIYNIQYPFATLMRLGSRVLYSGREIFLEPNLASALWEKSLQRLAHMPILAFRMWYWVSDVYGMFSMSIFIIAILWAFKKTEFFRAFRSKKLEFLHVCLIYAIIFVVLYTVSVDEEFKRHVVPLYLVFPFLVGRFLSAIDAKRKMISFVLISAMLTFNVVGNINAFLYEDNPPFKELVEWLKSKNFYYGYSGYEVAYRTVFESKESILISPTLFHPTLAERTPENTEKVNAAKNVVFILRHDRHQIQIGEIKEGLLTRGVKYKAYSIGPFFILYDFSKRVYPEEFELRLPGVYIRHDSQNRELPPADRK
ncbi:MAG: hypothetical protein JW800_07760 [Candidatus Omnitrophica bacterium]|nr:hypothetical protein [Candidatus Omnitrophota bacterium]